MRGWAGAASGETNYLSLSLIGEVGGCVRRSQLRESVATERLFPIACL